MTQDAAAPGGGGRRGWLLVLGALLSLASVGFLFLYIRKHWSELPPFHATWTAAALLLAACGLYFTSLLTTSGAWLYGLRALGSGLAAQPAFGVALTSQIGKYAPGNIAHHLGRAALAGHRGVPVMTTAKVSLMEIAAAVAAASLVTTVMGAMSPTAWTLLRRVPLGDPRLLALLGVAALIGVLSVYGFKSWLRRAQRELSWGRTLLAGSTRMLGCYALSFLFAGLSYYAVARAFAPAANPALCVAAYALAWVVGFITPGAPAGLGVRETILVVATGGALGPAAVSIAIVHRLVTAVGDAAGAGAGALILSRGDVHG